MNSEDKKKLEKYSSAFTLSDMEIFIFPELFYSLLLANIISPEIWKWRDDPWFEGIEKKKFNYRVNRVKQYIIQNYVFNLDLETWGLTTKEKEIKRFGDFFDVNVLAQSNALFGYEGDKYYFSIEIRKHFGLDKYNSNVIPYWKTETVEAMNAFRYKDGYVSGAGECVSLSGLYAAAMFIVGRIPLEKIFMIATPLHSQNFIDEKDGVITNNRRIVTKNMWFNGTSLSAKARRAIENEKITIVSHLSGYIHTLYNEATIDKDAYGHFSKSLTAYLKEDCSPAMFCNFLRNTAKHRKCFQFMNERNNKKYYIELERVYEYEHSSKNTFTGVSRQALLSEIDADEYHLAPINGRMILNDFEKFLEHHKKMSPDEIKRFFNAEINVEKCSKMDEMFHDFQSFIEVKPKLPKQGKQFIHRGSLNITVNSTREEILNEIIGKATTDEVAKLALYASRFMDYLDWQPFIKAAIERNPVSLEGLKSMDVGQAYNVLQAMDNNSIYEFNRLAMPDEVWNYKCGDGIEKAFLLANYIKNNETGKKIQISINKNVVVLISSGKEFAFSSGKNFIKDVEL